jgi:parvulin-like peptidyl-prolyl isomerase
MQVLLGQAADERKIQVPRADVNEAFATDYNTLLESNSITEADLESYLAQQNRTLAEFKDSVRAELEMQLRNEALRDQIVGVIDPTDEQLAAYFEANISQYDSPESIRASHILVPDTDSAQDIYQQLQAGADFAELAKEYSTDAGTKDLGGDLGWFERGMMVAAFEDAAFALEIGEISEPVQTSYGFHIIQLTDREAASVPTFEDVKDTLHDAYITDTGAQRFNDWYAEYYRAAEVVITDPLLNAYLMQGDDPDLAIAEYERLLAGNSVSDPYFEYYIGRAYESRMSQLATEQSTLQAIDEPTDEDLSRIDELEVLGEEYKSKALGHYLNALKEEAVEADDAFVNRVLLLDPDSIDARYILGELYADRGDIQNAEVQFDGIIKDSPTYIRAYIASGDLGMKVGEAAKAILRFENALALNPTETSLRASILTRLAKANIGVGGLDEAASYIQQLQGIDPGNAEITIIQGDLAAAQLAIAMADRDALEAIAERDNDQEVRLVELQGRVATLESTAVDYYKSAIQRLGTVLDLHLKLGQVYLLVERLDEAEDEFRMILGRSPYRVEAYEGLAEVLIAQGRVNTGLENLYSGFTRSFDDGEKERIAARILDFAPDDIAMRLQYAGLLAQRGQWGEAIR